MTSRPPAGVQRPAQQRSMSSSAQPPRPAPHRALSQQQQHQPFRPSSPVKKTDNLVDLTSDGAESANGRHASSKFSGSRLKLEIASRDSDAPSSFHPNSNSRPNEPSTPKPPLLPRGRPKLPYHYSASTPDAAALNIAAHAINRGEASLPMPTRPERPSISSIAKPRPHAHNTLKKDARPKPFNLEPPAIASRYPPNGYADFFPWTGDHPEDRFSESIMRQGYSDRLLPSQNETGSARASIFPALKQKKNLDNLSALFTGVLSLRRSHGQISSNPTFKPPPRVTLTDTKREAWLRELANPATPLRRLSRTIPHGIRGKILLDQCLNKNVPTERAVWLAKCVGANEIRAFKRKGASGAFAIGGEAKWIRDWTVFVEQFIDGVVNSCGKPEWRAQVNYAVRLAAHLYSEQLLDRDHYLDWVVNTLENSPLSKIPIWILTTQIYWPHLLQQRKHGRRLVNALCFHLQAGCNNQDKDILSPISDRIAELLKDLLRRHPENFICISSWSKYRDIIEGCIAPSDHQTRRVFDSINRRTSRLSDSSTVKRSTSRQQVVQLLDSYLHRPFCEELAKQCWEAAIDHSVLVQTVLDWATTSYRPGLVRVYIAVRLMRAWSRHGVDVNGVILEFLDSQPHDSSSQSNAAVFHLVSELVRSEHFSVARYLQWLIARGGIHSAADLATDASPATRLLVELPTHNLSDSVMDLRDSLLARVSFPDDEDEYVETYIEEMENFLLRASSKKDVQETSSYSTQHIGSNGLSTLSRSSKSDIGLWLRSSIHERKKEAKSDCTNIWKGNLASHDHSDIISPDELDRIEHDLEMMGDFSMLADILKMSAYSGNVPTLAAVANILNLHVQVMTAIGAAKDIFDVLLDRFRGLKSDQREDIQVILAPLSHLANSLPGRSYIASQLSQELIQRSAIDACSPVSDHTAETIQNTEPDDIDKILASGTNMDAALLERLFQVILGRLESSSVEKFNKQYSCGLQLVRLKAFDAQVYDGLMVSWLEKFLQRAQDSAVRPVLSTLIGTGSLSFDQLFESTVTLLGSEKTRASTLVPLAIAVEILALLFGVPSTRTSAGDHETVTLRIRRSEMLQDRQRELLGVIRQITELCGSTSAVHDDARSRLLRFWASTQFIDYVQALMTSSVDDVRQKLVLPLAQSSDSHMRTRVKTLLCHLLEPCQGLPSNVREEEGDSAPIRQAIRLANELTLPFCQMVLAIATGKPAPSADDPGQESYLVAFAEGIKAAAANNNLTWTTLLPMLDGGLVKSLHESAEQEFLKLMPDSKSLSKSHVQLTEQREAATQLLSILGATTYNMAGMTIWNMGPRVVEKLNCLWESIAQPGSETDLAMFGDWLSLLIDLLTVKSTMFEGSRVSLDCRIKILVALSALAVQTQVRGFHDASINERIFDVAIVLVDNLPDDARMSCVKWFKDKTSDMRVRYLFGYAPSSEAWLQLSQKGKTMTYPLRRWEILSEPTPNIGENDTSLSLTLFQARKA